MAAHILHDVLSATGYLVDNVPAKGLSLDEETCKRHRAGDFVPDALWRSDSALTVYFTFEHQTPSDEAISKWRRAIWNKGFAPLLWVVSPERVDIYNGFGRPRAIDDAEVHRLDTFLRIEEGLDKLDSFAGRLSMETGEFWRQAPNVDRRTSVDRQLLYDLAALERVLSNSNLDRLSAQGLIGRSIFTQYLIDRGIITSQFLQCEYGHDTFNNILCDRYATTQLFEWLRQTFNGDMFGPHGLSLPEEEHLAAVANFLSGMDPESGQYTLFPYQFDVIPIELISLIYEQFAHSDPSTDSHNSQTDVFYTRFPLVSLVIDEISENLTGYETVLDLACGSGVFLVEALRRLVAIRSRNNRPSRETIRSTLHQQIFGVDISEPAVQVAAFSLYLAALELDPNPQPPEALKFEPLIGKTLIIGDARNIEDTPEGKTVLTERGVPRVFDLIIGNSPWSYPLESVRSVNPDFQGSGDHLSPRGVSLNFVISALRFASDKTRIGLILRAVNFFARSNTGSSVVRHIVERLSPITLVNLSYHATWLFPHANSPAMILFARNRPSSQDVLTTVQVPWSPVSEKTHTFEISRDDIITLPLRDWQYNPELLKAAFFGSRRDLALLRKVTSNNKCLADRLRVFGTKLRTGLTVGDRSRDASFLRGLPLLTKDSFQPFVVPENLFSYDGQQAQRPRDRRCYRAPLLLVQEMLHESGRPVAATSNRDLVFMGSLYGAAMPTDYGQVTHILASILNSAFASWYFLMTASTFGLWKRRVLLRDVESIPIPEFQILSRPEVIQKFERIGRKLQRLPRQDDAWKELDDAVFDLYEFSSFDRIVARDGLFQSTWQWKKGIRESVALAQIEDHIVPYAEVFLSTMDMWFSATKRRRMRCEIYNVPCDLLRVVRFEIENNPGPSVLEIIQPEESLSGVLQRIGKRLQVSLKTVLTGQRTLRVYGPNEVVIIKPAARRYWLRVTALEDADAVVLDSISGKIN